ncbi:hypothetical protein PR048_019607 [Dryococelus australis]|uniref:Uncharacterized protein n=1 Tax=Dryococelus australis TaxID=614101 RepID=A0ABQ9H3X9_9NEOP|nr:hypothetical protein PR048_019607 [Dryococelus australis]
MARIDDVKRCRDAKRQTQRDFRGDVSGRGEVSTVRRYAELWPLLGALGDKQKPLKRKAGRLPLSPQLHSTHRISATRAPQARYWRPPSCFPCRFQTDSHATLKPTLRVRLVITYSHLTPVPNTASSDLAPPMTLKQFSSNAAGAAVAERLDCSPPIKANRVQSPAGTHPNFRKWESYRTMPLVDGFSRGSPVSPPLAFRRCSTFTSFHPRRAAARVVARIPGRNDRSHATQGSTIVVPSSYWSVRSTCSCPSTRTMSAPEIDGFVSTIQIIRPSPPLPVPAVIGCQRQRQQMDHLISDRGRCWCNRPSAVVANLGCLPLFLKSTEITDDASLFVSLGNRAGRCLWSAGFLGYLPFPPSLQSGAAPFSPHFTPISYQDLAVKGRPNLSQPLHSSSKLSVRPSSSQGAAQRRTETSTSDHQCSLAISEQQLALLK